MEDSKIRVFELNDLQPSTFILEGTENTSAPIHLSAAAYSRIPNISMRKISKGPNKGKWERIRYIKGCPTIVEAEQKAQHYEPNLSTGADTIWFQAGKLFAATDLDPQLVEFLNDCSMNTSNLERKPDATPLFKELTEEKIANEAVTDFFTTKNVMDYLSQLVIKDGDGHKYDQDRIDNLCALLLISGFDPSQYNAKFNAISNYAINNQELFLTKVADRNAEIKAKILQGLQFGIIGWEEDKLVFADTKRVIVVAKGKTDEARMEEAVVQLMKGESFQLNNLLDLEIKKEKDKILILQ